MTDEYIIKRKLLFDGEGIGDDRRINYLQKLLVKWILTDVSQDENKRVYNKILLQLHLIEYSRKKSELVKLNNEKQLRQYKDYQTEIENNIASILDAINISKILLAKVKYDKHRKLHYDMIVKDIVEQPSRIETTKTVEQLQLDLNNMRASQQILKNEFIMWRKHFTVLLSSANQMCTQLNKFASVESELLV
ncbi:hypothetical protein NQ315_015244 [Exocentrus adspersus]|uniref:Uncharacterized protein n=1 Tax=Exocentrus adspersus TaxID=1586481 RepID=A0AAV8VAD2_9CUCU|nr:hypothetical protein NQ315_015244 [Exocentrus adspersus]